MGAALYGRGWEKKKWRGRYKAPISEGLERIPKPNYEFPSHLCDQAAEYRCLYPAQFFLRLGDVQPARINAWARAQEGLEEFYS